MNHLFTRIALWTSHQAGHARSFIVALALIVAWGVTGPLFGFSDTWQLVVNTGTTIITFLMVFLIQNTQNRDTEALQLKLDELIRVSRARNNFINLEDAPEEKLKSMKAEFAEASREAIPASTAKLDEVKEDLQESGETLEEVKQTLHEVGRKGR